MNIIAESYCERQLEGRTAGEWGYRKIQTEREKERERKRERERERERDDGRKMKELLILLIIKPIILFSIQYL